MVESWLTVRSSHSEVFCKKGVLTNFTEFTGKHECLRPTTLLKKRLWHRCFPVNFVKLLRTPLSTEHLRWLLLYFSSILLSQSFVHVKSFLVLLININHLRLFACILLWNSLLIIPKYISSRSIDLKASKTFSIKINLFDVYQTIFHFCFYWWTLFYRLSFPYCPKHCTKMKFFINFLRFGHIYYKNP